MLPESYITENMLPKSYITECPLVYEDHRGREGGDGVLVGGEVPPGEKMLYSGTDPASYIIEYTLIYDTQI
jgi:hypothetical protein